MRNDVVEDRNEEFTIRLVNKENGNFIDADYKPNSLDEIWENVQTYLDFCKRSKSELKVTIETAFEYTNTPYWIFFDDRTSELIQLYFAMKQNPMFLFGNIETTPTLWIDAVATLNLLWDRQ